MTSRRGNPGGMVSGVDVDICYFHAIVFVSNIYIYIHTHKFRHTHMYMYIYIYIVHIRFHMYIYTHSHTHITHLHTYNDDSFMYSLLLQSVDFGS